MPYDFVFSYSSLEHDGLGRYGDVLNPIGDLQSMAKLISLVRPGGHVAIGVPCCHDRIGVERTADLWAHQVTTTICWISNPGYISVE